MRLRRTALLAALAFSATSCAVLGVTAPCGGTEVIGRFEQVGDLVENANVQSSDVEIGTISDIKLDRGNWEAVVTMCIDQGERISEDVAAVVRSTSLLGEKFVDLQVRSPGPPYIEDGAIISTDRTSKAAELEDVFTKLAAVLGTGNLEQINKFTTAQANILRDNSDEMIEVLDRLRRFTGVLADRKDQIANAIDSLDSVARTALADSGVLNDFLESFADSSVVLADQKEALNDLLFSLDRFTSISVQLLDETQGSLDKQFAKLRPVLRTAVENSANVAATLRTLATFAEWWPQSMPGDYLQLDVCQASPHDYDDGDTCPQAIGNDDPKGSRDVTEPVGLQTILEQPLRGDD